MTEKLKLPKRPVLRYEKDYGYPIRIRKATHNLLDVVSDETGWSKVEVIAKMVEFAFDNIEWVSADEYVKNNKESAE